MLSRRMYSNTRYVWYNEWRVGILIVEMCVVDNRKQISRRVL